MTQSESSKPAKSVQTYLKSKGHNIPLTLCYEAIARAGGFKNRHTAAKAKTQPLPNTISLNGDQEIDLTGDTLWVSVKNLSVYIKKNDDNVAVAIYPKGRENSESLADVHAGYDEALATDIQYFERAPEDEESGTETDPDSKRAGGFYYRAIGENEWTGPFQSHNEAERQSEIEHTTRFVISAEVHTDDHRATAKFDAESWFKNASDNVIRSLAAEGWGSGSTSDEIALSYSDKLACVGDVFKYLHAANQFPIQETIGFSCTVDSDTATTWIAKNRPELYKRLVKDGDIDPVPEDAVSNFDPVCAYDGPIQVELEYIGEGISGDYNPDDPNDVRLLRFTVTNKDRQDEPSDENSFCTGHLTVDLPRAVLERAAAQILAAVKSDFIAGRSIRRKCADLTHLLPESIPATVHTQNGESTANFDAVDWFKTASKIQIQDLINEGWEEGETGDQIAQFFSNKNDDVAKIFKYISDYKPEDPKNDDFEIGCSIDEESALRWLRTNRPDIHKQLDI